MVDLDTNWRSQTNRKTVKQILFHSADARTHSAGKEAYQPVITLV